MGREGSGVVLVGVVEGSEERIVDELEDNKEEVMEGA